MTSAAGWQPASEAEIDAAIRLGDLKENRHLDVKRELGTSDSSRKETARDLASLAISGGVLLIGVDEPSKDQFALAPMDLAGEAERLEQIAANRVEPPVLVTTREIASESSPGKGYLWVEVPPSSLAPHMVDGAYWGRADKTKARLTDAQVVLLHSRRTSHDAQTHELLDEEIDRDPVEEARRQSGHLYLVAWPLQGGSDAAVSVFAGEPQKALLPIVQAAEEHLEHRTRELAPKPSFAGSFHRRAHGVAFTSIDGPHKGRTLDGERREQNAVDIEFREDGGIRVFMGRMTADRGSGPAILDGLAVAYVRRLTSWALDYGKLWGYSGPWGFGIAASGLRGLSSSITKERHFDGPVYDQAVFREVTTSSTPDLEHQPWLVAKRLVGRLVRGLGTEDYYLTDLTAPDLQD